MSKTVIGFLFKKGFHPARLDIQERVWKNEESRREEEQRILEVKKQLESERNSEDLIRAHRDGTGGSSAPTGLEWMYSGGSQRPTEADRARTAEEYLTGKRALGADGGGRNAAPASDFDIVKVTEARMVSYTGIKKDGVSHEVSVQEAAALAREDPMASMLKVNSGVSRGGTHNDGINGASAVDIQKVKEKLLSELGKGNVPETKSASVHSSGAIVVEAQKLEKTGERLIGTKNRSSSRESYDERRSHHRHSHKRRHNDDRKKEGSRSEAHERRRSRSRGKRMRIRSRSRSHGSRDRTMDRSNDHIGSVRSRNEERRRRGGEREEGRRSRERRSEREEGRRSRERRGEREDGRRSRERRGEREDGRRSRERRGEREEGRRNRERGGERDERNKNSEMGEEKDDFLIKGAEKEVPISGFSSQHHELGPRPQAIALAEARRLDGRGGWQGGGRHTQTSQNSQHPHHVVENQRNMSDLDRQRARERMETLGEARQAALLSAKGSALMEADAPPNQYSGSAPLPFLHAAYKHSTEQERSSGR